jgi:apolipoprotein N-acyltransferase
MARRLLAALVPGAVSGALLALAIPQYSVALCAWFGLVPCLWAIHRGARPIWAGMAAGLVASSARVYWLVETLHLYGNLPTWSAMLTTALLVLYLSLYYLLFFLVYSRLDLSKTRSGALAAALWVGLEWAQTWMLSGFPWEFLGLSQYLNLPLVQLVSVTGVYGLSFLIVLVNVGLTQSLVYGRNFAAYLCPPLALLLAVWFWGQARLDQHEGETGQQSLKVGVVQGSIPQGEKWKRMGLSQTTAHYVALTQALASDNPKLDLIIFPETALPFAFNSPRYATYRQQIETLARSTATPLLVGSLYSLPDTLFNRAFLLDHQGIEAGSADKVHLVPFGEYLPFPWFFSYLGELTAESGVFTHGVNHRALTLDKHHFGVFICYESIFPSIARSLTLSGAEFLVNTTNDAWFGLTAAPHQHFSMAVMRAVENSRPVVRAANTGISGLISATGRILYTTPLFTETHFAVTLKPEQRLTFYTRFGDLFVLACMALLGVYGAWKLWRRHAVIAAQRAQAEGQLAIFSADPLPLQRPVVLLHGYASSPATWRELRRHLRSCFTNADTHVHCPDLNQDLKPDTLATTIAPALPAGPIDLIGHSLGALVGVELALSQAPIRRLFALAPPFKGTHSAWLAHLLRLPLPQTLEAMRPKSAYISGIEDKTRALGLRLHTFAIHGDWLAPFNAAHRRYWVPLICRPHKRHSLAHTDPRIVRDLIAYLRQASHAPDHTRPCL